MIKNTKNKGFTLIELVVVIAILGVLAGIAIPRFLDAQASARGAKLVGDLRTIDSAINLYATKYGKYPTDIKQITTNEEVNGEPSEILVAEGVVPPTSDMLVKQRDGNEETFESADSAYKITQLSHQRKLA